jgi:hypothetical protein
MRFWLLMENVITDKDLDVIINLIKTTYLTCITYASID